MDEFIIVGALIVAVPAIAAGVLAIASVFEQRAPAPVEVRALRRRH